MVSKKSLFLLLILGLIILIPFVQNQNLSTNRGESSVSLTTCQDSFNVLGNVTDLYSANDGTGILYIGSSSYGDIRNLQIDENGLSTSSAFVRLRAAWFSPTTTFLKYTVNESFVSIHNMTILIQERVQSGSSPLYVSIKNYTSGSFVDLSFSLGTSSSYQNHQKTIHNTSNFNLMHCFDTINNQVEIRLHSSSTEWFKAWDLDYTHVVISGEIDKETPQIIFTRNVMIPTTEDVITFNACVIDDSSIQNVFIEFNGDIGLADNISFFVHDLNQDGDNYTCSLPLLSGNWTVTVHAIDQYNNTNTSIMVFEVEESSIPSIPPHVILTSNLSKALRNEPIKLTLYAVAGTHNLSTVWIHDGFLASNQTLETSIDNKTTLIYDYVTSSSSLGTYSFTAYVNDTENTVSTFSLLDSIKILSDLTPPTIKINHINDTYLGVNHYSQVNFTVSTKNMDYDLDDVWMYDPISDTNLSIDMNIEDKNEHTYLINVTSTIQGTYRFFIFVNDTNNLLGEEQATITWSILEIKPIINVYPNTTKAIIGNGIKFFITIEKTEYDLSTLYYYLENGTQVFIQDVSGSSQLELEHVVINNIDEVLDFYFCLNDSYNNTHVVKITVVWNPSSFARIPSLDLFYIIAALVTLGGINGILAILLIRSRKGGEKVKRQISGKKLTATFPPKTASKILKTKIARVFKKKKRVELRIH